MKKGSKTDAQIVQILREAEEGQLTMAELFRKHEITSVTFYRWRKLYGVGGNNAAAGKLVKDLQQENARLKKALAEQLLAVEVLKEINAKKW